MLLIMIFNFFVGLVDVYVAGFIGPSVQAAVGFVSQLFFLTILVANALSMGTVALLSRALGAEKFDEAVDTARQSLLFSLIPAAGIMAGGLLFSREIVIMAGFPPEIRQIAEDFLRIFSLAVGPNYIVIITNAVFRSGGEVKKTLFTMSLVSVVNILGNFVLVLGLFSVPSLGYRGIALSTALAMTAGMVANFALLLLGRWRAIFRRPWGLSSETVGRILRLSWPAALLQIAWNAASIVLYNILGRLGEGSIVALAALTNGLRIEAIIYLPAFALNMAASVLVGQNLGAENPQRAERAGWHMAAAGAALVSVMALLIFIGAERCASLVTDNPAVLDETARYLRITMLSEPFMALSAILGGGLQGAGDIRGTMWVVALSMWLIRLPLAFVLGLVLGWGAPGVWTAMVVSMIVQGLLMSHRFHAGLWKKTPIE